jgi:hypothetical protein
VSTAVADGLSGGSYAVDILNEECRAETTVTPEGMHRILKTLPEQSAESGDENGDVLDLTGSSESQIPPIVKPKPSKRFCLFHFFEAILRRFLDTNKNISKSIRHSIIKILHILSRLRILKQVVALWKLCTEELKAKVTADELADWDNFLQYFENNYLNPNKRELHGWFGPTESVDIRFPQCDRTSGSCENTNKRFKDNYIIPRSLQGFITKVLSFMQKTAINQGRFVDVAPLNENIVAEGYALYMQQKSSKDLKKAKPIKVHLQIDKEKRDYYIFYHKYSSQDLVAVKQELADMLFVNIDSELLRTATFNGVLLIFEKNPALLKNALKGDCFCGAFRRGDQCAHLFQAFYVCDAFKYGLTEVKNGQLSIIRHHTDDSLQEIKMPEISEADYRAAMKRLEEKRNNAFAIELHQQREDLKEWLDSTDSELKRELVYTNLLAQTEAEINKERKLAHDIDELLEIRGLAYLFEEPNEENQAARMADIARSNIAPSLSAADIERINDPVVMRIAGLENKKRSGFPLNRDPNEDESSKTKKSRTSRK